MCVNTFTIVHIRFAHSFHSLAPYVHRHMERLFLLIHFARACLAALRAMLALLPMRECLAISLHLFASECVSDDGVSVHGNGETKIIGGVMTNDWSHGAR